MAWLAFASAARAYPSLDKPWLSLAAARLADGGQWLEFAANNVRLFNGITVFHYFSGARPWALPYDAGVIVAAVLVLCGFVLASARRRSPLDAGLIAGCAGTWLLFYAFAGPQALRPHAERWGLCLLVPASLVLARGAGAWMSTCRGCDGYRLARRRSPPLRCSARSTSTTSVPSPPPAGNPT